MPKEPFLFTTTVNSVNIYCAIWNAHKKMWTVTWYDWLEETLQTLDYTESMVTNHLKFKEWIRS